MYIGAALRPSTVKGGNEGANTLFDTVDVLFGNEEGANLLFGTVDREDVGNEEGANLLLLPPLWSALENARLNIKKMRIENSSAKYLSRI